MDTLRKLFWVVLTLVFTFGFVVLYENGMTNYLDNAQRQFQEVKGLFATPSKKKPGTGDQLK